MKRDIADNTEAIDYRALKRQLQADIDYKTLGRHMQAVRLQRGMTQAVVAERMKIGVKYYSRFEVGTEKISLYRLIQFICIRETSADYLLAGCHLDYPPSYICPDDSSPERKQLNVLLDQCSDAAIKTLLIVAKGLIERDTP